MDSMMEEDQTLPIDFDQTSNFARFLLEAKKVSRTDSMLSDMTLTEMPTINENGNQEQFLEPQVDERPLSRGTLREQETVISELKKENFGLKMRIYYMEQRLHDAFDSDTEDLMKTNIELKVTIEHLKNENQEKKKLLSQASVAMEQIASANKKDDYDVAEKMEQEFNKKEQQWQETVQRQMMELQEAKRENDSLTAKWEQWEQIASASKKDDQNVVDEFARKKQQLEETVQRQMIELQESKGENDSLKAKLGSHEEELSNKVSEIARYKFVVNELQRKLKDIDNKRYGDEDALKNMITELEKTIAKKDDDIENLKENLNQLADSPERSNQHYKTLYERVNNDLSKMKTEMTRKDGLIEGLKQHAINADKVNKGLRCTLHDKELEHLRDISPLQDQIKQLEAALQDANEKKFDVDLQEMKKKDADQVDLIDKINTLQAVNKDLELRIDEIDNVLRKRDQELERSKKNLQAEEGKTKEMGKTLMQIRSDLDLVSASKDTLQKQLEDAYQVNQELKDQLQSTSKKTADQTDNFQRKNEPRREKVSSNTVDGMDDFLRERLVQSMELADAERSKFKNFLDGFKNNREIGSQVSMLNHELSELEDLQGKLRSVLLSCESVCGEEGYELKHENEKLAQKLADAERMNTSLQGKLNKTGVYQLYFDQTDQENRRSIGNNSHSKEEVNELIQKLSKENESLKLELESEKDECSALQEDLQRREKQAVIMDENMNNKRLEYEHEIHERDVEISKLTAHWKETQENVNKLNMQIEKERQQNILRKKELDGEKRVSANLEVLKEQSTNEMEKYAKEKLELKNKLHSEQERTRQLVNKNEMLVDELDAFKEQMEKLDLRFQKISQQLLDTEEQATEARALLVERHDAENSMLKKDVEELFSINERLRSKIKENVKLYDTMNSEKGKEINVLSNKLEKAKKEIERLRESKSSLANELVVESHDKLETASEKQKEITMLSEQLRTAENINQALRLQTDDMAKAVDLKNKVLMPELNQLREEVDRLREENQKQRESLALNSNQGNELFAAKMSAKELLIKQSDLEDELRQLKSQLETATVENRIMKQDKVNSQRNFNVLLAQVEEVKEENGSLKSQLNSASIDTDAVQKLLAQVKEVKEENSSLKARLNSASINNDAVQRLQDEIENLRQRKVALERQLKEVGESAATMKKQLSISLGEKEVKDSQIRTLEQDVENLEQRLELFIPLQTSSRNHLPLSSNSSTQTDVTPITQFNPSHAPKEDNSLIALHIQEMRELRKQLEETIKNNDALRKQLEDRLSQIEREAQQMKDPHLRITLIRENDALRAKVAQNESSSQRLKSHIDDLLREKNEDKETISSLHVQIHSLNELSTNLKHEMEVYDRLVRQLGIDENTKKHMNLLEEGSFKTHLSTKEDLDKNLLMSLLQEIRDLREQLKKSMDINNALKLRLEDQLGRPVTISPVATPQSIRAKRSLFASTGHGAKNTSLNKSLDKDLISYGSIDETPTKDFISDSKSFQNSEADFPNVMQCSSEDYKLLTDTIHSATDLLGFVLKLLVSKGAGDENSTNQSWISSDLNTLMQHFKNCSKLLANFTLSRQNGASAQDDYALENKLLKVELLKMKKKLASQEHFIKSTLEMMEANVSKKESIEKEIASQLSKTRDTVKAAKGSLQVRTKKAKSLDNELSSSINFSR